MIGLLPGLDIAGRFGDGRVSAENAAGARKTLCTGTGYKTIGARNGWRIEYVWNKVVIIIKNIMKEVLVMPGKIKDISQLLIDQSLSKEERIKSYLEQMEDPYHYIDNGTTLRLRFADTSESLTDRLILAAQALKI